MTPDIKAQYGKVLNRFMLLGGLILVPEVALGFLPFKTPVFLSMSLLVGFTLALILATSIQLLRIRLRQKYRLAPAPLTARMADPLREDHRGPSTTDSQLVHADLMTQVEAIWSVPPKTPQGEPNAK